MKEFASINSFQEFVEKTKYSKRYFFDGEIQSFLGALIGSRGSRIGKYHSGQKFWRAQLGFDVKNRTKSTNYREGLKIPYDCERMKPLRKQARAGRANPAGIPYLYLATTKETAMAEVRPWLGSIITVARFETTRELTIIDCFTDSLSNMNDIKREFNTKIREQKIWADINQAFSKPVSIVDQDTDYIPTQVISEFFRIHGFDGILYNSMLGEGINVVLFNIDDAECVSCELQKLDGIKFQFKEID
jgi:hypothetical protein